MKIKGPINSEEENEVLRELEAFTNQTIHDDIHEVENKLSELHLGQDLVERGPTRNKLTDKTEKFYIKQNSSTCTTSRDHQIQCDKCLSKLANSSDFLKFCEKELENMENGIPDKSNEELKDPLRRLSVESGYFSPLQDNSNGSPTQVVPNQNQNQINGDSEIANTIIQSQVKAKKEILKEQLDKEIKLIKWVATAKLSDKELIKKIDQNMMIQDLLSNNEGHFAESFYALIERLKKSKTKPSPLITYESSIFKALKDYNHSDLLYEYFQEAVNDVINQTTKT